LRNRILIAVVFLSSITIAAIYMAQVAYAGWDYHYDEDEGPESGSTTWAYAGASWPPRYHDFYHDEGYDYGSNYWGPPPTIYEVPGDGESASIGYTYILIHVYQGAEPIEDVYSEADLPPPE
jgi:hypothetical protein